MSRLFRWVLALGAIVTTSGSVFAEVLSVDEGEPLLPSVTLPIFSGQSRNNNLLTNSHAAETADHRLITTGKPAIKASRKHYGGVNLPEHAWPMYSPSSGQIPRVYYHQPGYLPIPDLTPLGPLGDWDLNQRKNDV
ncbi:MAG: hypothetical protein WD065_05240 [Planctomycetaceae bacterium]